MTRSEVTYTSDEELTPLLQQPPPGWTLEADEELARFLVANNNKYSSDVTAQGSEYLTKIEASSGEVNKEREREMAE